MDSGWNLAGHLLSGKLLEAENLNSGSYDSPYWEIGEPSAKLDGQIQLVNFVPESIVPNTVECFLDIKEGSYYMLAPIEAFHNCLRETEGDSLLTWIS